MLVDRAQLLTLTAPEMTVLVGGMRVLNTNADRPGTLSNDFFVNLLSRETQWQESSTSEGVFEGHDPKTGETTWTGNRADLVIGSNSQLRALAEVYGSQDGEEAFVQDFAAAWTKVMNLDRFDIA